MDKIALFFGPLNGSVHHAAKIVAQEFGEENIDLIPVNQASINDLNKYGKIIFGISTVGKDTWDQEFSNTDWAEFFPVVRDFDFSSKKVALFGLGDHITYAYHFVDSMGFLARIILKNKGTLIGRTSPEGYNFQDSEALKEGLFLGLPLDEDYEKDLTPERVKAWVAQLKKEF
ncbi:flavodoxin domain-containing protein [Prolixibacter sp. SD074]|uniref:flavodoxin domain-containing protein n=1 Tax=Prolixibacter sp. SD074 TaxID=2652391 RepID=UPI00127BED31|nr:flavodoxin domain-containing protein [Prolixibacter sp. SD074]GET29702.1 flavodoxin [Prolixibacter sp. SD074]